MNERELRMARKRYSKGVSVDHIAESLDRSKTSAWDKTGAEEHDGIWGDRRKASLIAADTDKLVALARAYSRKRICVTRSPRR